MKTCPYCGASYETQHPAQVFCSDECQARNRRDPNRLRIEHCRDCRRSYLPERLDAQGRCVPCAQRVTRMERFLELMGLTSIPAIPDGRGDGQRRIRRARV